MPAKSMEKLRQQWEQRKGFVLSFANLFLSYSSIATNLIKIQLVLSFARSFHELTKSDGKISFLPPDLSDVTAEKTLDEGNF